MRVLWTLLANNQLVFTEEGGEIHSPAPYVRATTDPTRSLHILCNSKVLSPMISSYSAGEAVVSYDVHEQVQNSLCTVISNCMDTRDKPREAVNETMDYYLPAYEG